MEYIIAALITFIIMLFTFSIRSYTNKNNVNLTPYEKLILQSIVTLNVDKFQTLFEEN